MYVFFDKRWKIVRKIWNLEKSQEHYQKKEFGSNPVYNGKYIKTKTKSYNGKINIISIIIKFQKKLLNIFAYQ